MTTPKNALPSSGTLAVLTLDPIGKRRKESHLMEGKPELPRGYKASPKMCGKLVKLALATFSGKSKRWHRSQNLVCVQPIPKVGC